MNVLELAVYVLQVSKNSAPALAQAQDCHHQVSKAEINGKPDYVTCKKSMAELNIPHRLVISLSSYFVSRKRNTFFRMGWFVIILAILVQCGQSSVLLTGILGFARSRFSSPKEPTVCALPEEHTDIIQRGSSHYSLIVTASNPEELRSIKRQIMFYDFFGHRIQRLVGSRRIASGIDSERTLIVEYPPFTPLVDYIKRTDQPSDDTNSPLPRLSDRVLAWIALKGTKLIKILHCDNFIKGHLAIADILVVDHCEKTLDIRFRGFESIDRVTENVFSRKRDDVMLVMDLLMQLALAGSPSNKEVLWNLSHDLAFEVASTGVDTPIDYDWMIRTISRVTQGGHSQYSQSFHRRMNVVTASRTRTAVKFQHLIQEGYSASEAIVAASEKELSFNPAQGCISLLYIAVGESPFFEHHVSSNEMFTFAAYAIRVLKKYHDHGFVVGDARVLCVDSKLRGDFSISSFDSFTPFIDPVTLGHVQRTPLNYRSTRRADLMELADILIGRYETVNMKVPDVFTAFKAEMSYLSFAETPDYSYWIYRFTWDSEP